MWCCISNGALYFNINEVTCGLVYHTELMKIVFSKYYFIAIFNQRNKNIITFNVKWR